MREVMNAEKFQELVRTVAKELWLYEQSTYRLRTFTQLTQSERGSKKPDNNPCILVFALPGKTSLKLFPMRGDGSFNYVGIREALEVVRGYLEESALEEQATKDRKAMSLLLQNEFLVRGFPSSISVSVDSEGHLNLSLRVSDMDQINAMIREYNRHTPTEPRGS